MFIDIHGHCIQEKSCPNPLNGRQYISTPDVLVKRYDEVGIEKAVILPLVNPENCYITQSNEEPWRILEQYPGRFIPFCNLDPRTFYNNFRAPLDKLLGYYHEKGAKGVGEVCANLPILDPRMQNLFAAAEETGMVLTFHLAPYLGNLYGMIDDAGLPQLEISLKRFPKLKFFGHSQTFWAEMGANPTIIDRLGYPKGKIEKEGRIPQLMREYPNLYGDLSAGSGCNALSRDREHAAKFLEEFQDRLFFGTDICCPDYLDTPLVDLLLDMRAKHEISETVFQKVARENAIRVLGL